MRRVLLVSEARALGGAEVYLDRIAASMSRYRADLAVPALPVFADWTRRLADADIGVLTWKPGVSGALGLARLIRRGAWDIVHVNLPSTYDGACGLLPWTLAALGGHPVVATEHLTRIPRSRRRRVVKRAAARGLRAVITVSESSRRDLLVDGLPPAKVIAIPNGVPGPDAPPPQPPFEGGLRVGVLAALEERKQVGVLVEAAARSGGRWRLEVAGAGPLAETLATRARELGLLGDRVRFAGRVADPAAFLARQHVLALPSRLEAMPLAVLEAAASGRGALLSALPGMDEIVIEGETGRLLRSGDIDAWRGALDGLAAAPETAARWGIRARRLWEERFTLDRAAGETESLYDRVLGAEARG